MITPRFLKIFFLIVFVFALSAKVSAKTDIEFILDVSGSMVENVSGAKRIDLARQALLSALDALPEGNNIAVRVYGHRIEKSDKANSCKDTELLIPFGPANKEAIQQKIMPLTPKGYTPIAYSLEQSRNDFSPAQELRSIVLLTDGEETCDGDAVAVLKKMKSEGFDVVVNVIGMNVDAKTREQLKAISDFSGGQYYDAQDADQLNQAFKEATAKAALIEKTQFTYGQPIRGGDNYNTAVTIQPNVDYRLDHHQKVKEYDFFAIELQAGQEAEIQLSTFKKGLQIGVDGKIKETDRPYAGMQLHTPDHSKLKEIVISGSQDQKASKAQLIDKPGRYYVLIGHESSAQNMEGFTFQVKILSRGDAGTDKDAGTDFQTSIPIQTQRYATNYLGSSDKIDVYSFSGKKGEKYFVGVIPTVDIGNFGFLKIKVTVTDEYKQTLASKESADTNGSGVKTSEFTLADEGTYYIEVKISFGAHSSSFPYVLDLKKVESTEKEE